MKKKELLARIEELETKVATLELKHLYYTPYISTPWTPGTASPSYPPIYPTITYSNRTN